MTRPVVFMYSGQGSQYFHMTRELYESNARYRVWLEHCDEIASPLIGKSLLDTVFDPRRDKSAPFDSLPDSSAALICVEYSLTRVVQELGHQCDVLLGYSLGEITAAVVAEALPLEDGIGFAVEFARLLEQRTPRCGMLSVFGSPDLLRTHETLFAGCWVTGRNFDGNFVVSGRAADIDALEHALNSMSVLCQRLPVDYGVHTGLIDPVEEQARRLMDSLSFAPPQIPIISSATADRVDEVSADGIWAAVRQPVEFSRTIEKASVADGATFVDLGPSATLATFVKYIAGPGDGSRHVSAVNRFGNDVKSMNDFQAFMAAL
ncbi:acyltransferase domain-containing protein [Streptomyces sp. NPDC001262]|uniref:acyltransferase domain-containing protein n=1 Tax=Streptomyces TaxID=1883 RepID=UPI0036793EE4